MKKENNQTFEQLFCSLFTYQYDLRTVFTDFVSIVICTLAMNPETKQSYYEDEYLKTIEPYKAKDHVKHFATLFAKLVIEMEEKLDSKGMGNDVLGEFFEIHIATDRKSQFFTPWPICEFMARINMADAIDNTEPQRVIDPACGSGRMLMTGSRILGSKHSYYGIDVDLLCVRMTVINLFLNGVFKGEVMCANTLNPFDSFVESYILSFLPLRIFKITNKEDSPLWHSQVASFGKLKKEDNLNLVQKITKDTGSQLNLF